MKEHPSKKMMIDMISGKLSYKKALKLNEHLEGCETCSKKYSDLNIFLEKAKTTDDLVPPENILRRILASKHRLSSETVKTGFEKTQKRILLPAAVFSVIFFAVILFLPEKFSEKRPAPISFITKEKNAVPIFKGKTIITGDKPGILFPPDRIFTMKIQPKSIVTVENSFFDLKKKRYHFRFFLKDGTILAKFDKKTAKNYTFLTPTARITSTGTTFLLSVSKSRTELMILEGRMKVFAKVSGDIQNCIGGKTCIIDEKIQQRDLSKSELKKVERLNMSDTVNHVKKSGITKPAAISIPEKSRARAIIPVEKRKPIVPASDLRHGKKRIFKRAEILKNKTRRIKNSFFKK